MVDIAAKFDLQPAERTEMSDYYGDADLVYVLPEGVEPLVDLINHLAVSTTSERVAFHPAPAGDGCDNILGLTAGQEVERAEAIAEAIVDANGAGCWSSSEDDFSVSNLQDNLEAAIARGHAYSEALEPSVSVSLRGDDAGVEGQTNTRYWVKGSTEWSNTPEVLTNAVRVIGAANPGGPELDYMYYIGDGCFSLEMALEGAEEVEPHPDLSGLRSVPNWNDC